MQGHNQDFGLGGTMDKNNEKNFFSVEADNIIGLIRNGG